MAALPEDPTYTSFEDPHHALVKRIFGEVLQAPADQRAALLIRLCEGNEALLAEVSQLLDDHDEAGDYLNTPPKPVESEWTFAIGDVLANRFRVLEFLGSGGMGQVYRAEDMLSGGPVALKTIRPEIAADTRNNKRLRRELHLSRQVSHPNVCRMYELWSVPGPSGNHVVFLTMELLQGETLARRLAKGGKLSTKAALAIAKQIAAGMDEAHRIGIIHRDLKPSNVYLEPSAALSERVIVMDFGLARPALAAGAHDLTQTGALLGTPAYMAPELFNGVEASIPSDVYSFGVTLYEMLTGRNRMIVAPRRLVAGLDDGWERAISQCLDPEPAKRPKSMSAVIDIIERGPRRARRKQVYAAGVLAAVLFGGVFLSRGHGRNTASGEKPLTFDKAAVTEIAFAKDGRSMVYSSDKGTEAGNFSVWFQDIQGGERRQLVKSAWHDYEPAISPDGKVVAFRSERDGSGIYTVPSSGGVPQFLAAYGHNPRFSSDGKRIAYWMGQPGDVSEANSRAWVIPVAGGDSVPIAPAFADVRLPVWSPSGQKVIFWGARTGNPSVEQDLDWYVEDMKSKEIVRTGAFEKLRLLNLDPQREPVFWGPDALVFSSRSVYSNNIWEMGFSEGSPNRTGDLKRLTTGPDFEVMPWELPGNTVAYVNWNVAVRIWRVSTLGLNDNPEPVTDDDARIARPTVSSNGRFLMFNRRMSNDQAVYVRDLHDGSERTVSKEDRRSPTISPDGASAAYREQTGDACRIWMRDIASEKERVIYDKCVDILSWLPDSSAILLLERGATADRKIYLLDVRTGKLSQVLSGDRFTGAAISPDGRRISFTAAVDAVHSAIYTAPFTRESQVSLEDRVPLTDGRGWNEKPQWVGRGDEIAYSSNRDGFVCLWKQRVDKKGNPAGAPVPLVHMHKASLSPMHQSHVPNYSLSAGGNFLYFNSTFIQGKIWEMGR